MKSNDGASRSYSNHDLDCEVYILALFWTLQKSHTQAARKTSAQRQVVEVKRA